MQASSYRECAQQYFSRPKVDSNKIRLRQPVGHLAEPHKCVSPSYEELRLNMSKDETKMSYPTSNTTNVKYMTTFLRNKEYDVVLRFADQFLKSDPGLIISAIYGYIASICVDDDANEFKYYNILENTFIHPADHSHYFHLMDEIIAISHVKETPLLLSMIMGDISNFKEIVKKKTMLIPSISTDANQFTIIKHRQEGYTQATINKMKKYRINVNNMPELRPVEEGSLFFAAEDDEDEESGFIPIDPNNLIIQGKYEDAVTLCSFLLRDDVQLCTNKQDLLFKRAIAFFKLKKYSEAIVDCERCCKISLHQQAIKLKNAIWILLGNPNSVTSDEQHQQNISTSTNTQMRLPKFEELLSLPTLNFSQK